MAGIQNAHLLTDIFGYWPSFHDAEVHAVHLMRGPNYYTVLEAQVHVFEMTSEVGGQGYYVPRHETLVTLRFSNLSDLQVEDFNHQNALFALKIKDMSADAGEPHFEVEFDPAHGFGAWFKCQEVAVLSAEACQV